MRDVRIIVTGGTIDKIHNQRTEGLSFAADGTTHIPEMLEVGHCYYPTVQLLMLKDSLDFDDRDRHLIADAVSSSPEEAVIVTHGTGTMGETARYLADLKFNKVVILTGAMRPFSLARSDGDFNLGGATVASQLCSNGVWGVMNGRVFPANDLRKNTDLGRFDA